MLLLTSKSEVNLMRLDPIALQIELMGKDWTKKKLAQESLLSYATIKNVFRGCRCSKETAEAIAITLDVDLEVLKKGLNYRKDV